MDIQNKQTVDDLGICPLCKNPSKMRKDGTFYQHKGHVYVLVGDGRRPCKASAKSYDEAAELSRADEERRQQIRERAAARTWGIDHDPA